MVSVGSARRRSGVVLVLVGVLFVAAGVVARPADADTTPVLWTGGGLDTLVSNDDNWGGTGPALDGSDTLEFPAGAVAEVDYDLGEAQFLGLIFDVPDYLVVASGDPAFPLVYGDLDLGPEGERTHILAHGDGITTLGIGMLLDPQEVPGHVTAADPGTTILCNALCQYLVNSGVVVFDGPGTNRIDGVLSVPGEGFDTEVDVAQGLTILHDDEREKFSPSTWVRDGGTLQLGLDSSDSIYFNGFVVQVQGAVDGVPARLTGNGIVAPLGGEGPSLFVGLSSYNAVRDEPGGGPGVIAPGVVIPEDPSEAIGEIGSPFILLGAQATYEVDVQGDGQGGFRCDSLETGFYNLGELDDLDNLVGPTLSLNQLDGVDIPAGSECTIVDMPTPEEGDAQHGQGLFQDGSGNLLTEGSLLSVPSDESPTGFETFRISYQGGPDGNDIVLRNVPNLRFVHDDTTEGDPAGFGIDLSDPVEDVAPSFEGTVHVEFTSDDGTALAPGDYTVTTNGLDLSRDAMGVAFDVPTIDDDDIEGDETVDGIFDLTYDEGFPTGYVEIGLDPQTATIHDNDGPISFTVSNATATPEGNVDGERSLSFLVTTDHAVKHDLEFTVTVTSHAEDLVAIPATFTMPIGHTQATLVLPIKGDTITEPDETVTIELTIDDGTGTGSQAAGHLAPAVVLGGSASGVILNDDGATPAPVPTTAGPSVSGTEQALPKTGAASLRLLLAGLALLLQGAVLCAGSRREILSTPLSSFLSHR